MEPDMPVTISDNMLRAAGMGEREARIEIACRLFAAGKLTLPLAVRLAGLARGEMEDELLDRTIPIYRPTLDTYLQDVESLRKLREGD
jgi:predicted HTH domain antitoxin